VRIEEDLRMRKEIFIREIDSLSRESESLQDFESVFMVKEANEQVDLLNQALLHLTI
jgi:hypothetical protein